jgi:hypothetical protein
MVAGASGIIVCAPVGLPHAGQNAADSGTAFPHLAHVELEDCPSI